MSKRDRERDTYHMTEKMTGRKLRETSALSAQVTRVVHTKGCKVNSICSVTHARPVSSVLNDCKIGEKGQWKKDVGEYIIYFF